MTQSEAIEEGAPQVDSKDARPTYQVSSKSGTNWVYLEGMPEAAGRIGIGLSGGGIRSASFSLGAMQYLRECGLYSRCSHIAAVSGGTYMAAAMQISALPNSLDDQMTISDEISPWDAGSPEETHLRKGTSFLSSGVPDSLWLASNYLYGLFISLGILTVGAFLVGRLLGSCLRWFAGAELSISMGIVLWLLGVSLLCSATTLLLVGFRRFHDKQSRDLSAQLNRRIRRSVSVLWALGAMTAAMAGLTLAVVHLRSLVGDSAGLWSGGHHYLSNEWGRLIGALLLIGLFAGLGGVSLAVQRRVRHGWLLTPLTVVSGPGMLLVPLIFAAETAFRRENGILSQFPELAGSALFLAMASLLLHNRRYSLHLFYRERLHRSFALERCRSADGFSTRRRPYDKAILISDLLALEGEHPNLIVCAAAAEDRTSAPYMRHASSFTFESRWVGGPALGYQPTTMLETRRVPGGSELTLPSVMAISGAAVSPLMGRFGRPALRFLMAMLNLRTGVWLPWDVTNDATSVNARKSADRNRMCSAIRRGWEEPGGLYVLFEALGIARTHKAYRHIADGGHWENLGLVELLRRRCTHIVVIDASAAQGGRLEVELARAARLALAELGVDLVLDTDFTEGGRLPSSVPFVTGAIRYPDGLSGRFVVVRCALWPSAPFDLKSMAAEDGIFPHHPTTNQFFSAENFDAYRDLGWNATKMAMASFTLPSRTSGEPSRKLS